jgi:probable F420-dependent oxidoreductase
MAIEIGLPIPQSSPEALDRDRLLSYLKTVDSLGFDGLWVTEQVFGPGPRLDPLVLLSMAAAVTTKPRLVTGILQAALRNPVLLAKTITSLDHLSDGRVTLGVAVGSNPEAYVASGLSLDGRGRQLEDCLQLMKRLWTEGAVSESGGRWTLDEAQLNPKPRQSPHPPIWFGGSSPVALKRAARVGSGWFAPGAADTDRFLKEAEMMRTFAADAGHSDGAFKIGKRLYIAIEADEDKAIGRLRQWFGVTYAGRPETDIDSVAVWGTAEQCLNRMGPILKANPDVIVLNPVFDEHIQAAAFADELVPALRQI